MPIQDLTAVVPSESEASEAQSLPRNKQINKDRYDLRIQEAGFKVSSKGNKMLELKVEIISPETIRHYQDGQTYNVAGLTCKKYVMLEKSTDLIACGEFMKRLGLEPKIDPEQPDTDQFVGKCFSDIISAATYENRKQATAEQLAEDPNAQGEVLIDPETGLPEISYGIQTGFGLQNAKRTVKPVVAAL